MDPFDIASAFERERVILGIASGAGFLSLYAAFLLISEGDLHSTSGIVKIAGGALVACAGLIGFRLYWNRI
ncbi:MAG TPA: hypothetical protein VGC56_16165 [Allosphingosinicella sp.]